ncbi:hypothetical protein MMC16_007850 [Acarospora aff. strigata]|nr:hypothetical protein [Acarospora aff. strigata]
MISCSSRSVASLLVLLFLAVASGTRLLGKQATSTTSTGGTVFGLCSSGNTVKDRVAHVQSWWQAQNNGLLLVDHVPDSLPAIPQGLHVQAADNKWKFVSSAERCAWSQVSDTHKAFPQADWYVLGDDDTFFIPEALEAALSKYDASEPWYIGTPSESGKQNWDLGIWLLSNGGQVGEFAFGGAGIIISQGLMQTLIPKFEECLHNHDGMIGGDQRIGACVKVLSPGTELTPFMGMHQIDTFHHDSDFLALLEAHPVEPLVSLHHLADVLLPALGDLTALRPYAKRNPYGMLQQSVCQSKAFGTLSIAAGLSVRWWDNSTDINIEDVTDYARRGCLPPVTRYFAYAKSLNTPGNLRSKTINTWYAVYGSSNSDALTATDAVGKIQVEEASGPGRWMAPRWDRLQCSHVSHNIADNSLHIVLGGPRLASARLI